MKPNNLKKLADIACLRKDKALTEVRTLASKLVQVAGDMAAVRAKTKALTVSTEIQDRQVLEKWLLQQQEKLRELARVQAELHLDMKAAKTRAGSDVGRMDVIENLRTRVRRARKQRESDRAR
jgi:hypothetical protein